MTETHYLSQLELTQAVFEYLYARGRTQIQGDVSVNINVKKNSDEEVLTTVKISKDS